MVFLHFFILISLFYTKLDLALKIRIKYQMFLKKISWFKIQKLQSSKKFATMLQEISK